MHARGAARERGGAGMRRRHESGMKGERQRDRRGVMKLTPWGNRAGGEGGGGLSLPLAPRW